jgi:heme/copper-type cytochrome/quinol oxidase subunit 3
MPRWLFEMLCVAAFSAPVGAAWMYAWPLVTGRQLPSALNPELALLAALILLSSSGLTMLMSARIQSDRR